MSTEKKVSSYTAEDHKKRTFALAKGCGFNSQDALAIANENVNTDSIWKGYSPYPFIGKPDYHLGEKAIDKAMEEFNRAMTCDHTNKTEALKALGRGTHALQDYCAHRNILKELYIPLLGTIYHHIGITEPTNIETSDQVVIDYLRTFLVKVSPSFDEKILKEFNPPYDPNYQPPPSQGSKHYFGFN